MSSKTESGHEVNVKNFKALIDYCISFGAIFNPSRIAITIAEMTTLYTNANKANGEVATNWALIKEPINARQILFKSLSSLITRIMKSLSNTDASEQFIKDAKTLANDIRGANKEKPADTPQDKDFVSRSHMSYIQRAANFAKLIKLLKTLPSYNPNEATLTIAALEAFLAQLTAANDGLAPILAPYFTAIRNRDKLLYTAKTGLIDLALACKDYVASMTDEGTKSPMYKLIVKIKFTRTEN